MDIILPFEELSDFIRFKFDQKVRFDSVDINTVKVTYTKLLISKSIDLKFTEIEPTSVTVHYNAGFLLNNLVRGVLAIVKDRMPDFAAGLIPEKGKVKVELSKIPQAQAMTENLELKKIQVRNDSLFLQLQLKRKDDA